MYKKIAFIFMMLFAIGNIGHAYADKRDMIIDSAEIDTQYKVIKNSHHTEIAMVHPDYEKIAYGKRFPEYISRLPASKERRKHAIDIILTGTSDEVISLLSGYKEDKIPRMLKKPRQTNTAMDNQTYQIGMLNKEGITSLVDKFVMNKKMEYQGGTHDSKIERDRPDYGKIINDPQFHEYINTFPVEYKKAAEAIVKSGSPEEVLALVSAYKEDSSIKESAVYKENTKQRTHSRIEAPIKKVHTAGEMVKLHNPADSCVGFYKDPSLNEIISLFTNGVKAKVLEVKDYNIYKVQVAEKVGWVSSNVIR